MSKIYIAIDDKKIEAAGEILQQILADQQAEAQAKAEAEAKAEAKAAAQAKLAAFGLTVEDLQALGL